MQPGNKRERKRALAWRVATFLAATSALTLVLRRKSRCASADTPRARNGQQLASARAARASRQSWRGSGCEKAGDAPMASVAACALALSRSRARARVKQRANGNDNLERNIERAHRDSSRNGNSRRVTVAATVAAAAATTASARCAALSCRAAAATTGGRLVVVITCSDGIIVKASERLLTPSILLRLKSPRKVAESAPMAASDRLHARIWCAAARAAQNSNVLCILIVCKFEIIMMRYSKSDKKRAKVDNRLVENARQVRRRKREQAIRSVGDGGGACARIHARCEKNVVKPAVGVLMGSSR